MAACSGPSCSFSNSLRAFSAAIASFLFALLWADALRSSDALPKEKARLSLDFPGFLGSFLVISANCLVAGVSAGVVGVRSFPGCVVGADGDSIGMGLDKGEGLVIRFESSDLLLPAMDEAVESVVPVSRTWTR